MINICLRIGAEPGGGQGGLEPPLVSNPGGEGGPFRGGQGGLLRGGQGGS